MLNGNQMEDEIKKLEVEVIYIINVEFLCWARFNYYHNMLGTDISEEFNSVIENNAEDDEEAEGEEVSSLCYIFKEEKCT